jgi:glycosyltransferase involved in cell wall biosynthesis
VKILFVHQNYPGQYKHLLPYCGARGHQVVALGTRAASQFPASFPYHSYAYDRSSGSDTDPLGLEFESKMIRARSCANAALHLRDDEGFYPDVICVHTGWGEDLFLPDIWPTARLIGYCEYFYNSSGYDLGFDPEYCEDTEPHRQKIRAKNASILVSLQQLAAGVTPTQFQLSTYPERYRPLIRVIHDGIDVDHLQPRAGSSLHVRGRVLTREDPVVTFVSRSLEPARGFHQFMRSIPYLQALRPDAHVIIVGSTEGGYGARPEIPFKHQMLQELEGKIDLERVYFVGRLPYKDFTRVLAISRCHVYLTVPFVLSWSLLESMASGCLVLASNTAPVQEVIEDGVNGLLVDFFDSRSIAFRIVEALERPPERDPLRVAARQTIVDRYERRACLQRHHSLIDAVAHHVI